MKNTIAACVAVTVLISGALVALANVQGQPPCYKRGDCSTLARDCTIFMNALIDPNTGEVLSPQLMLECTVLNPNYVEPGNPSCPIVKAVNGFTKSQNLCSAAKKGQFQCDTSIGACDTGKFASATNSLCKGLP